MHVIIIRFLLVRVASFNLRAFIAPNAGRNVFLVLLSFFSAFLSGKSAIPVLSCALVSI